METRKTTMSFDFVQNENVAMERLSQSQVKVKVSNMSLLDIKKAWDEGCHVDYHGGYEQLLKDIESGKSRC